MGKLLLVLMLSISVAIQGISAVTYTVNNLKGGTWFDTQIGVLFTKKIMDDSTNFIWVIFDKKNTKPVNQVSLFIDDVAGVANTTGNKIYINAKHIQEFGGDKKKEFKGIIYRQMSLVWLYNGHAPVSLSNGMADLVRLKADLKPTYWTVKPGQGNSWNENEYVTARFLQYFDYVQGGFVRELNKKMKTADYKDSFITDILGLTMPDLWVNYQKNASGVIHN